MGRSTKKGPFVDPKLLKKIQTLNSNRENAIYNEMLNYRVYPQDLFIASEQRKAELMSAMQAYRGR